MALLSWEGTSKKENNGALPRISQALDGLFYSLGEFREVETMLARETSAGADHGCSSGASPNFLRFVAGTLKEMVGNLVSDLEAKPEIQKLRLVTYKSVFGTAFPQNVKITEQPSCPVRTSLSGEKSISGIDSRTVKRAAVERVATCRHSCEHHPELMDPFLWSTLPKEMVELVITSLSIPKLIELRASSTALSRMSKSTNFRRVCSEKHPKLFGLVGPMKNGQTVYDIKSNEWCFSELSGMDFYISPADLIGYDYSAFACDGGLVCYVPQEPYIPHRNVWGYPILVGNPLTDAWKALPRLALDNKKIKLMQLVMEEGTKCYRVMLVCREKTGGALEANCYNSETTKWSKMESGLVYGSKTTLDFTRVTSPRVFDCTTKTLYELDSCSSLVGVDVIQHAMVKDRLFVFHMSQGPNATFQVSEYAWQSSSSNLSRLSIVDCPLPRGLLDNYNVHLFACSGSLLLFADNCREHDQQHQLVRRYDSSAKVWHSLSVGTDVRITEEEFPNVYMCELRWDVVP